MENSEKQEILPLSDESFKNYITALGVNEKTLSPEARELLREKIIHSIAVRKNSRVMKRRRRLRYCAAAAATVALAVVLHLFTGRQAEIDYASFAVPAAMDGKQSNVHLITGGKNVVDIAESHAELIYDNEGKVNINAGEKQASASQPEGMNQLIVPYGRTSNVVLSDGTKIWINAGSRVIYPSVFAGNKREIFVEGEIYLEVAKNEQLPFIVKTGKLDVKVLGTSFNISAYAEENRQSIVLVEGTVSVRNTETKENVELAPSQMYDYRTDSRESHVEEVNVCDHTAWKYGFFQLRKKELPAVFEWLKKYYNAHFEYDHNELAHITVSGKLDLKDNITQVLHSITLTANVRFEIREDKIIITLKP